MSGVKTDVIYTHHCPLNQAQKEPNFLLSHKKKCKDISMFINKNFFKQYRYVFIYKRTYTLRFCL